MVVTVADQTTSTLPSAPKRAEQRVEARVWHASLTGKVEMMSAHQEQAWQVVHLRDTPEHVHQPALLDDVVCIHRGAKEVQRTRALRCTCHDVAPNALTVMPRGKAARWRTRGPIDYTHIVFAPKALDHVLAEEFGKRRDEVDLNDTVGLADPLLERLLTEMAAVVEVRRDDMRLYMEGLFTTAVLRLFHRCSDDARDGSAPGAATAKGGLPGWKVRRVVDYLHDRRAWNIGYDELTALTGLSRAQFFRAFKQSLGFSPGRYLERIRLAEAKLALEHGFELEEAAAQGGFASVAAMTASFRRCMGVTPSGYRRWYR